MSRLAHKLKSGGGETLTEVLASILIATLSVALLFTCIMASAGISRSARAADDAYYKALTAAELQDGAPGGAPGPAETVRVTVKAGGAPDAVFDVELYGGGGLHSYKRTGG